MLLLALLVFGFLAGWLGSEITEIVLPLHDRDIDPQKLESLAADTL